MPAIRDFTTRIGTTTTVSACPLAMPAYQQNDLLVAILCTDTNTVSRVWQLAGWTRPIDVTNTAQLTVLYKIAGASEVDPIFTTAAPTAVETVNAVLISIRDVDTTNPFGSPMVSASFSMGASAVYVMPQITTTKKNCLVIYATANSSVGVPSIIEGPVTSLVGQDGGAESMGVAWGFEAASGATPLTIKANTVATGAGVNLALMVAPPTTGASVIPGYCASDLSKFIDPINGTTAYNSNTAFSNTATTYFGTTLNGAVLSNGTVAALADYGINSFHSVGQLTNAASANRWYGATTVLTAANKIDVGSKNILVHAMPVTPKTIQTTDVVTKSVSGLGLAFGICSRANTDYRVWHVHGAGTSWGTGRTPCVINASATAGRIQNTGTLSTPNVSGYGYFVSGTDAATIVWSFASLWLLDTVTICGGNAAEPLNIPQIVTTASDGHERMSLLKQGAGQMLVLQPIQFGNGGADPIYMQLDSTAIEFPRQYDKTKKEVYYNSIDNAVGITYYAGSGDTIKHYDSVVSSPSHYTWGFHSSSASGSGAASASYDFSGLAVIGAGTVSLHPGIDLVEMTFNACDQITWPSNHLINCVFTKSAAVANQAALMISASTSAALVEAISDDLIGCTFSNNTSPSGALGLTYTGPAGGIVLNMSGNTFSGNKKDIYWAATAGSNLTINLSNGANPSTYSASGANTVTFVNSNTFTISNIAASSEVRVFKTSGQTELCGVEDAGFSSASNCTVTTDPDNAGMYKLTYTHSQTSLAVYVVVCNVAYQFYRQNFTLTNSTQGLLVNQIADRQYLNP